MGRVSSQSASFHTSAIASTALQDAQSARGVPRHKHKSTETANATRWTGIFRSARKSRLLEPDIKLALTGDKEHGECDEEPAALEFDGTEEATGDRLLLLDDDGAEGEARGRGQ